VLMHEDRGKNLSGKELGGPGSRRRDLTCRMENGFKRALARNQGCRTRKLMGEGRESIRSFDKFILGGEAPLGGKKKGKRRKDQTLGGKYH